MNTLKTGSAVARMFTDSATTGDSYTINKNSDGSIDVMLYGSIGWEIDAADLVAELKASKATQINLYINSPGGDAFDGTAIYNALKNHPARVVTNIEGIAASAASLIAMAGDEVQMAQNAYLMIHNASGLLMGESKDMRQCADMLDKINVAYAQTFASKAGGTAADFTAKMDAETWYLADEAKAAGLIDTITGDDAEPNVAPPDLQTFAHAPDRIRAAAASHSTRLRTPIRAAASAGGFTGTSQITKAVVADHLPQGHRIVSDGSGRRHVAVSAAKPSADCEAAASSEWDAKPRDERAEWIGKKEFVAIRARELAAQQ